MVVVLFVVVKCTWRFFTVVGTTFCFFIDGNGCFSLVLSYLMLTWFENWNASSLERHLL